MIGAIKREVVPYVILPCAHREYFLVELRVGAEPNVLQNALFVGLHNVLHTTKRKNLGGLGVPSKMTRKISNIYQKLVPKILKTVGISSGFS